MLVQTKAVVLHLSAYNDRYQIAHLYTADYGRLGALIPHNRRSSRQVNNKLLPLSEIEFIGTLKLGVRLVNLKELHLYRTNQSLYIHPIKYSQSLFISELLFRILQDDIIDPPIYKFITNSLYYFDQTNYGLANFYLCFCYRLLYYLAIAPTIKKPSRSDLWFNLKEAEYDTHPSVYQECIPPHHIEALYKFSRITYFNMKYFKYNREERSLIIDYILHYYRLHLPSFGAIKSLDILRSTFK